MWAKLRNGAAVLCALGLALACGKTDNTGSGETHFVTCSVDTDCQGLSDVPTCSGGYCRDADGNKVPDSTNSSTGNDDGPQACASGCGNSECATPGSCTVEAACKVVGCDSAMVDAEACVRPACESDADCPEDERCLYEYWARKYTCEQHGNSCECQSGLGLFPMHVCSPTSLAGPRGNWDYFMIEEIVIGMETQRSFWPDGRMTVVELDEIGAVRSTVTKQLSSEDLEELTRYINGADLRLALSAPHDCEVTKATDMYFNLWTDSQVLAELQQSVAGCTIGSNPVPIFRAVYDLAYKY